MMDKANIEALAKQVATATLGIGSVASVSSAPTIDSEGQDALQLTIVLSPAFATVLNGSQVVKTMVQVHDSLQKQGEQRSPFVNFTTEGELIRFKAAGNDDRSPFLTPLLFKPRKS